MTLGETMTAWAGRSNKGEGVTIESLSLGLAGETQVNFLYTKGEVYTSTRQTTTKVLVDGPQYQT